VTHAIASRLGIVAKSPPERARFRQLIVSLLATADATIVSSLTGVYERCTGEWRGLMQNLTTLELCRDVSDRLRAEASAAGLHYTELAENILRANLRSHGTKLYQASTSAALVQGVLQGSISSAVLLGFGDFGVGTFEHLDGEMVILDGEIFQVCADHEIKQRSDEFKVPFAQVCWFDSPQTCSLLEITDLASLEKTCDLCRSSDNLFYAFRINAHFDSIHTRTVKITEDGTSLESAGEGEVKFAWNDVPGTLVGFWSPSFTSSFSVPGYHFHFISDDRSKAGHVLDCSFKTAASRVQALTDYEVALPSSGVFLKTNLGFDTRSVLRKVE